MSEKIIFGDEPDEVKHQGHTAGIDDPARSEFWFHRAMLVAWPKILSITVACQACVPRSLDLLETTLERNDLSFKDGVH